jgi:prophage regulatory protein
MTTVKILRRPAVSDRYGIPRSTLYDLIAKDLFPRPILLGTRAVGWRVEDLDAWESSRAIARVRGIPG